ncbi:MAG: cell division protein FtsZ, partial [Chloroflexota bacterium]
NLLDVTIDGARGILFNITGGSDLSLYEVNEAATIIKTAAHPDCNVIFGSVIDENMKDQIRITVVATGFDQADSTPRRFIRSTQTSTSATNTLRSESRTQHPNNTTPIISSSRNESPPAGSSRSSNIDPDNLELPSFLRRRS